MEEDMGANLTRYIDIGNTKKVTSEIDAYAQSFFDNAGVRDNTTQTALTPKALKMYLPKRKTPVADLIHQWKTDEGFRQLAVAHLKRIIEDDVRAMTLNPVLGSLWRVFCNDQTVPFHKEIISSFSQRAAEISNGKERENMKNWLEESYDYTAQILGVIGSLPEEARFPCVYLDPTLRFERAETGSEGSSDDNRAITEFTRSELLEIGRSCDTRIMRRLGRILTRLTYVENANDLPQHIARTTDAELPEIPIALTAEKHKREFWRIPLHTVLPGTMLAARPATLLAALSLRMGIEPLRDAAESQMKAWKEQWNDTKVPEIWSIGCLLVASGCR